VAAIFAWGHGACALLQAERAKWPETIARRANVGPIMIYRRGGTRELMSRRLIRKNQRNIQLRYELKPKRREAMASICAFDCAFASAVESWETLRMTGAGSDEMGRFDVESSL